MSLGPIPAIQALLKEAGMTMDDIDAWRSARLSPRRSSPPCGPGDLRGEAQPVRRAIALGHLFGMTGARIMTTLLNYLETLDMEFPRSRGQGLVRPLGRRLGQ